MSKHVRPSEGYSTNDEQRYGEQGKINDKSLIVNAPKDSHLQHELFEMTSKATGATSPSKGGDGEVGKSKSLASSAGTTSGVRVPSSSTSSLRVSVLSDDGPGAVNRRLANLSGRFRRSESESILVIRSLPCR